MSDLLLLAAAAGLFFFSQDKTDGLESNLSGPPSPSIPSFPSVDSIGLTENTAFLGDLAPSGWLTLDAASIAQGQKVAGFPFPDFAIRGEYVIPASYFFSRRNSPSNLLACKTKKRDCFTLSPLPLPVDVVTRVPSSQSGSVIIEAQTSTDLNMLGETISDLMLGFAFLDPLDFARSRGVEWVQFFQYNRFRLSPKLAEEISFRVNQEFAMGGFTQEFNPANPYYPPTRIFQPYPQPQGPLFPAGFDGFKESVKYYAIMENAAARFYTKCFALLTRQIMLEGNQLANFFKAFGQGVAAILSGVAGFLSVQPGALVSGVKNAIQSATGFAFTVADIESRSESKLQTLTKINSHIESMWNTIQSQIFNAGFASPYLTPSFIGKKYDLLIPYGADQTTVENGLLDGFFPNYWGAPYSDAGDKTGYDFAFPQLSNIWAQNNIATGIPMYYTSVLNNLVLLRPAIVGPQSDRLVAEMYSKEEEETTWTAFDDSSQYRKV